MSGRFRAGDTLVERHVFDGAVVIVRPVTVVAWDERRLVTWLAPGSEIVTARQRVPPYAGAVVRTWRPPGMLQIVREGDPYALALLRTPTDEFAGWYVNLQEPLVWTDAGYDTRDNLLDVWRPANAGWVWKDEDELAAAVAAEALSAEEAERIRMDGERALRELELPTGWEGWQPDDAPALALPNGWDR